MMSPDYFPLKPPSHISVTNVGFDIIILITRQLCVGLESGIFSRTSLYVLTMVYDSVYLCVTGADTESAVQQSQVSSSKPTIPTEDILGPLLLEVSNK